MPPVISKFGVVLFEKISVHSSANSESDFVKHLSKGDKVFIYDEEDGWGRISLLNQEWIELSSISFQEE